MSTVEPLGNFIVDCKGSCLGALMRVTVLAFGAWGVSGLLRSLRRHQPLLGGSWVVVSGAISRVRILSHFMGLITPLLTPHEAPSNSKPLRHLTLQDVFWTFPCFRVEGFRVEGFRV